MQYSLIEFVDNFTNIQKQASVLLSSESVTKTIKFN